MHQVKPSSTVAFMDKIDAEPVKKLLVEITKASFEKKTEWVTLFLSSPGGSVYDGLGAYNYVCHILRPKLQTVALGFVGSMAPILFLMGEHRVMTRDSRLWFHHVGRKDDNPHRIDTRELEERLEHNREMEKMYHDIVVERTGGKTTLKHIREFMRKERRLTPKEAMDFGFAHEIVSGTSVS